MRFGVREICDVVFKARTETKIGNQTFKKGQPVLYLDTAKTSTLEGAATTVYAQGGQGNPRLVAWEGERTLTFTVEDALISPISFAMLSGAGLANVSGADSTLKVHTTFDMPILDGGKVILTTDDVGEDNDIYVNASEDAEIYGTILDEAGAGVVFCTLSTDVEPVGQMNQAYGTTPNDTVYEITEEAPLTLTFAGADKYVGRTMRVDCYCIKKGTDGTEITIDAKKFAGSYYVEASTLFREQATGEDMPAQFVIPNAKIQSNFTFNMSASGDPSTFTFTMDAFPAYTKFDRTHKVFAAIQIIGQDAMAAENITLDTSGMVNPQITEVIGGVEEFDPATEAHFPNDNRLFSTLGRNLKATIDGANITFEGTLNRVDNWTAFSSNPVNRTGYYYPFTLKSKPVEVIYTTEQGGSYTTTTATTEIATAIKRTDLSGVERTINLITGDGENKENFIWAIDPEHPVVTVTVVGATATQDYAFDFGRVVFS